MSPALETDHFTNPEDAWTEDGPDFLFVKNFAVVSSLFDFFLKGMIQVLVEEWNFVEGGAKSILQFGVCPFQVQDMLVFFWEFFRKVDERLLVGFLVSERVFLEEVQSSVVLFPNDWAIGELSQESILVGECLSTVVLTHSNR